MSNLRHYPSLFDINQILNVNIEGVKTLAV